jgi:hypothetical protein
LKWRDAFPGFIFHGKGRESTRLGGAYREGKAILETSPTEPFEHAEHAEHVAHLGDRNLTLVSMTIAILAVFAATVGSLETLETAGAVGDKTHAVLLQNKASDSWSFYQAKSLKQNLYALAAAQGGARTQEFSDTANRYANEQKEIEKEAKSLEAHSEEALASSERHERRHHILTVSVTMLHVGIAVATIAIIVRGQLWPWRAAIALGLAGAVGAIYAYVT